MTISRTLLNRQKIAYGRAAEEARCAKLRLVRAIKDGESVDVLDLRFGELYQAWSRRDRELARLNALLTTKSRADMATVDSALVAHRQAGAA